MIEFKMKFGERDYSLPVNIIVEGFTPGRLQLIMDPDIDIQQLMEMACRAERVELSATFTECGSETTRMLNGYFSDWNIKTNTATYQILTKEVLPCQLNK